MKVLVLAGSGFLGSWAVRAAVAAGHETSTLVRLARPWRLSGLPEAEITPMHPGGWAEEIRRRRPEVLVMLDWAGVSADLRDTALQYENVVRQRSLIEAAIHSGVGRIVGAGSQAEYGPTYARVSEETPARPVSAYGHAKLAALHQLTELCERSDVEWVWARVFSVFGPLDNERLLLATIADGVASGAGVELGSGEQAWSYLYAADAGRAFELLASSEGAKGVVNVGHPDAPPLRRHIETFAKWLPSSAGALHFAAATGQLNRVPRLEPDVVRLRSLGWEPLIGAAEGLRKSAEWLSGATVYDSLENPRALPARSSASAPLV